VGIAERALKLGLIAAIFGAMALQGCSRSGHGAAEGVSNNSRVPSANGAKGSPAGGQAMSSKARPWNRTDVTVYRPEAIPGIEYDPKERKAVDPGTGEFLILRPGMRESPGQFVFGTVKEGIKGSGGYTAGWYPDERISVIFINALQLNSAPGKKQSRSEFDATPIARMMRGFWDAAFTAEHAKDPLRRDLPIPHEIIIDTRPEKPTAE
jgi:hypothetical protein